MCQRRRERKTALRSSDPSVLAARSEAEKSKQTWEADKSDASKYAWKEALKNLYTMYDQS